MTPHGILVQLSVSRFELLIPRDTSYIYNANGFLPFSVDYSFMLQANWLKFGMLMCFDMGKDNTEPENGKNP